jgi:outer membrane lipoprotein SlyB
MNTFHPPIQRSTAVIALALAMGLAGCGPKTPATPTALTAPVPMNAQDPNRVGQPVPPVQGSYGATAPVYAQAPVQTAQVQPQYAPQPAQYPQQPQQQQPQQYAQQQPQQQQPQQQYAPPPPQYAPAPAPHYAPQPAPRPVASANLGEVEHIEPIRTRPQGSGAGAVIGGVLGAVVGNQFGHGNGKAAMTVIGAGGGAMAGNNIERNRNEGISGYRISVRMDNGSTHVYEEASLDGLRIGDRVRVAGGRVRRV